MKKLVLKKQTISTLNQKQMDEVRAGGSTSCGTYLCCDIASQIDPAWCKGETHAGFCKPKTERDIW